jgi:hypothetical protein
MRELMGASPRVKNEALLKMDGLITELSEAMDKWSTDGKSNIARKLQRDAKKDQQFDLPSYIALTLSGCWLEGTNNPNNPRYAHVLKSIEMLRSEAKIRKGEKSTEISESIKIIELCKKFLSSVICLYFAEQADELSWLIYRLQDVDDRVRSQFYAISFGFLDAFAQIKNIDQSEHLLIAIEFFSSEEFELEHIQAIELVGELMSITPKDDLFFYIKSAGEAVMEYKRSGELESITNLAETIG